MLTDFWEYKIAVFGYEFVFLGTETQEGIIIPPDADLSDGDYVDALMEATELFKYVKMFNVLRHAQSMWYASKHHDHFSGSYDRTEVLHLTHEFMTQDKLTVPEWVKEFANTLVSNKAPTLTPIDKPQRQRKSGFVYLLKSETGHYKIGRTVDPKNRAKTFGIQLPFKVEFECLIKTEDSLQLERELHQRFYVKRINGEWFDLTEIDVEYIKGLAHD